MFFDRGLQFIKDTEFNFKHKTHTLRKKNWGMQVGVGGGWDGVPEIRGGL